jgi:hypothetical protein
MCGIFHAVFLTQFVFWFLWKKSQQQSRTQAVAIVVAMSDHLTIGYTQWGFVEDRLMRHRVRPVSRWRSRPRQVKILVRNALGRVGGHRNRPISTRRNTSP